MASRRWAKLAEPPGLRGQRYTSVGIFERFSTAWVSLPYQSSATPRRPCEDIRIRSQPCARELDAGLDRLVGGRRAVDRNQDVLVHAASWFAVSVHRVSSPGTPTPSRPPLRASFRGAAGSSRRAR